MPRGSELRVVFSSSQKMCVGEGSVTLFAKHRSCSMFSLATVDYVCSLGYFIRVPPASVRGSWVRFYTEFVPVHLVVFRSVPKTPSVRVGVVSLIAFLWRSLGWLFQEWCPVFLVLCALFVAMYGGPRWGVCLVKCDVRWDLSVHYRSCCQVGRFIVDIVRVWFDFTNVCLELLCISSA